MDLYMEKQPKTKLRRVKAYKDISDKNRIGDIAEVKACLWLLENGYEVFRNVCCTGVIDVVAIKNDEIFEVRFVDVKSNPRAHYDKRQIDWNVEFLYVNLHDDIISFEYKDCFPKHNKKSNEAYMRENPHARKLKRLRDEKWKANNRDHVSNYNKDYYKTNKKNIMKQRKTNKKISLFYEKRKKKQVVKTMKQITKRELEVLLSCQKKLIKLREDIIARRKVKDVEDLDENDPINRITDGVFYLGHIGA